MMGRWLRLLLSVAGFVHSIVTMGHCGCGSRQRYCCPASLHGDPYPLLSSMHCSSDGINTSDPTAKPKEGEIKYLHNWKSIPAASPNASLPTCYSFLHTLGSPRVVPPGAHLAPRTCSAGHRAGQFSCAHPPSGQTPCASLCLHLWLGLEAGSCSLQQPQNDALLSKKRAKKKQ